MEGPEEPTVANDASGPIVPPKSLPKPTSPIIPEPSHTYVVQIPRDQIYRVPPPEHSKIAERYQTLQGQKKGKCGRGWLCWAVVIALAFLAIGGGIMFGIIQRLYKPKVPIFTINDFHVKNMSKAPHVNPSYEILLITQNSNERMGVLYKDGGTISISYEKKTIGKGTYRVTFQDAKSSIKVKITLAGLQSVLLGKVEKSIKNKETKLPTPLSLAINVPVKLTGGIISFSKNLKVTCDFHVKKMAIGTKISSQHCNSEF